MGKQPVRCTPRSAPSPQNTLPQAKISPARIAKRASSFSPTFLLAKQAKERKRRRRVCPEVRIAQNRRKTRARLLARVSTEVKGEMSGVFKRHQELAQRGRDFCCLQKKGKNHLKTKQKFPLTLASLNLCLVHRCDRLARDSSGAEGWGYSSLTRQSRQRSEWFPCAFHCTLSPAFDPTTGNYISVLIIGSHREVFWFL